VVEFFRGRGQKLGNSLGVKPILLVEFFRGKLRISWNSSGGNAFFCKILQTEVNPFLKEVFRG